MFPHSYDAVLRVPEDAGPAAIRHAYRTLVRRFIPIPESAHPHRSSEKSRKPTTFSAIPNDDTT